MYGNLLQQPWNLSEADSIRQRLLMQKFPDSKNEEDHDEEEREAKISAGGFPHPQIACKNEKKEEALVMAVATNSPSQSSAEDIFSDTMELASYLHRRVQEISKQFRHRPRPFRINTDEKGESLPEALQGLSCTSELPLEPCMADFQTSCDPAQLEVLRKNPESYLQGEERAPSLAKEKISSEPCFTGDFLPGLRICAEMKECTPINLYDNGFGDETFNKEMSCEARTCNLFQRKGEDAHRLPLPQREEKFPLYSEKASGSVCFAPLFPKVEVVQVASLTQGEESSPLLSENAAGFPCRAPQFPSTGPFMYDASPENASDVNAASFQEVESQNISLDAANCPPFLCPEGKSPTRPTPQSPFSTPSHKSSKCAPPPLCHSLSGLRSTENLSMALRLLSLQHHAISDAEDCRVLPHMRKGEQDHGHPEHSISCVVVSQKSCHEGLSKRGEGDAVLQESVGKQVGMHTQNTDTRAVTENASSPHSLAARSVSSIDSSECDNCAIDTVNGHVVTDRAGSRDSNAASGNKSEETDAMSEAGCLDTHRKDEDEDDDGTIVVAGGGDPSHLKEIRNDALDLLLDAIQVTSGGVLAAQEEADACRPSSLHMKKHAPGRKGEKSLQDRKESSSAKVFQTTEKVPMNGQSCLPKWVYGSVHPGAVSFHDIQDNTHEGHSPELPSYIVSLPLGRFPVVRKRSFRRTKTVVEEEPGGNSVPTVVRFKSLQAVSEVNLFNNQKGGKELAANKGEQGRKVLLLQEREKTVHCLQSGLNGKREKAWENKQENAEEENQFSKQEKRARLVDADDLQEGRGKGQLLEGVEVKDDEEQAVMSRRARSQVLPNKFSDSVLQPWKKRDRRKI